MYFSYLIIYNLFVNCAKKQIYYIKNINNGSYKGIEIYYN